MSSECPVMPSPCDQTSPICDLPQKGVTAIKAEYLIPSSGQSPPLPQLTTNTQIPTSEPNNSYKKRAKRSPHKSSSSIENGQSRRFVSPRDKLQLCSSRVHHDEFSPGSCKFGLDCRYEHDLRKYLTHGKLPDLSTFNAICPMYQSYGCCPVGWKCRFVTSHSCEIIHNNGQKELTLKPSSQPSSVPSSSQAIQESFPDLSYSCENFSYNGIKNVINVQTRIDLSRRKINTDKANQYIEWMANQPPFDTKDKSTLSCSSKDNLATFVDPPFKPSEKRRLYYGPETPVLAPLTTQGNLAFRRLCVELGAQVTWSEMALGLPLVQGEKGEWALLRAHQSELEPPSFLASSNRPPIPGYDNSHDLKFGVQIAVNKPWIALKTTEVIQRFCPHVRSIEVNCGCPIDLIYRQGSGSALLESPSKLEKIIRGMNHVSGDIPISVKLRMGTRDDTPVALKVINRLCYGSNKSFCHDGDVDGDDNSHTVVDDTNFHFPHTIPPCGVAAITLHGRSRQQHYTRRANWEYISECGKLIDQVNATFYSRLDTHREPDERDLPNGGRVYFIGNGDTYSHIDYESHIRDHHVDTVMIARGALMKPWIFEEISARQYIDKSASERLTYIKKFARYGLETWGTDEVGVNTTRRFLLEYLSFAYRYVPIGILEYLPPHIQDRPPLFRGRNDLETLLASSNYKDWIKISEMFLGPTSPHFTYIPKYTSSETLNQG